MPPTNKTITIRVGLLLVVVCACLGLFATRSQTFPQPSSSEVTIVNASVLKDWMPDNTYVAALQHIRHYLAIYNIPGTTLTVTDTPQYAADGSLSFNFSTGVDSVPYGVTVQTANYGGGLSSSAVSINGKLVTYAAADSLYGAQFSNFDKLIDSGLTGQQVYEIQQALNHFAPNGTFDITTDGTSQQSSDGTTKT
ncbi:MAG: hypothetical protein ACREGB_04825, partial [Candidatus Saccharimonadales bacterium]